MNHIYRLVWNRISRQWVAVAETVRGQRGAGGATVDGRAVAPARALLALSLALAFGGAAWAAPQGGQVVSGSGSIGQAGATTTIRQDSNRLSLDWRSFDVGAGETVRFVQPDARAIAVNRVLGNTASEILGRLQANGQVWLLNPNGILFGRNAQVNVGGLVASTLLAPDGQAGGATTRFGAAAGKAGGSVVNQGSLQAADGGYVALLGHTVSNQGSIVAPKGTVALGAGGAATLTFSDNRLVQLQIDQGTLNDLVENRQLIQADGGRVFMSAGARDSVLASVVNNTGVVQARTVENRGGTIVLLGGMAGGTTTVGGTLDASAPDGGNGGFIETSAHVVDVAPGAVVTTRAARGQSGTWLVDPADYTIAASGGNQTPAQLAAALAAGNVTIASATGSNAASGSGSIFVNGDVSWGSANTLTLNAANNVEVNAVLAATGSGGLTINTASALSGGSPVPGGRLNVNMDRGGRVDLGAAARLSINGNLYGVITTASELASADDSGFWALGSDLSVTALPDKSFLGTFNGLGHSVTNTGLSNPAAMFYEIAEGAVVENLSIRGARVALFDRPDLGILAVTNNGTVRNVSTQGTLFGGPSTAIMGGLVAVNNGSISQSSADATILPSTGSGTLIGGLVGIVQQGGSIDASYATGRIQALASDLVAGGLVGYAIGGPGANAVSITRSFATANVTMRAPGAVAGGLVGIAGANVRIADAYATGSVVGDIAGGLVGRSLGSLERVYATGSVAGYNGASKVGGLVAERGEGSVSHAYWNFGGASQSPAGTGLTGAQIAQRASYAGFDFGGNDPTWVIYEGHTAPLLNVFLKPLTVTSGNQASATYTGAGSTASLIAPTYSDSAAPTSGRLYGTTGAYADRVNAGTYTPNLWSDQLGYRIGYVGGSLTITPATLTLSGSRAYDGTTAAAAGTFGANGVVAGIAGQTLRLTGSGTLSGKNAGSRSLALGSLALADGSGLASNYTLSGATHGYTIDQAVISLAGGRDYDGGTSAAAGIFGANGTIGGLGGETLVLSGTGSIADRNVGTKALALGTLALGDGGNGGLAGNYTLAGGTHQVTVDRKVVQGSFRAVDKIYTGTTEASVRSSLSGTVEGDRLVLSGSGTFADKNVGTGKSVTIVPEVWGADAGNYLVDIDVSGVTANIVPRIITGSFTAANKTYDGTSAATVQGNLRGAVASDAVFLGGAGSFADKNAGVGKAVTITSSALTGADAGNYSMLLSTSGVTADITPRAITGRFTAADKIYDATTAATIGGNLTGVLGTDAVALTGTGTFADKNAGSGKAVTIASGGLSGADAGNYTLTAGTTGITADITRRAITGGFTAANKTYDATTAATVTGNLAGVLGTDAVALGGTGTFADKNAGTGKAVTIANSAVTGADAGNYTVTANTSGVTADIAKLAITGSYTAANKTYDATTVAVVTGSLTGVLGRDAVALNGTGTFADKNAGSNKAVTIDAGGLTGADAGNYTVTAGGTGVTADITRRAITGSFTAANKTYDATTAATVSGSLAGVLGTDAVALGGTGIFADKNAGTGKAVAVTSNGLSGADAGNYTVTAGTSGVTADIARRAITGSFTAADKTYDATTAATVTGSLNGVLGTDAVALNGTGTFADKNAGTGKAVAVTSTGLSGADAGNYAVTANTTGVTADITKRAITGSYTAANKTYDATTAATVIGTLSGVLGTDAVALSGTGTFADKNAGTGKAVTIGAGGLTGADAGNYTVTAGGTGVTADIAKLAITGSYTAADKTYDATTAATVTGSLNGVLGSDAVVLSGTGTFADKNAGTGKVVAVTLTGLSGADAGNYTVTASTAGVTANIAKLAISGSYTAANKTYDATTAATVTGSLAGVLGTDAVALNGTGAFADKNAGTDKAVAVTSTGLSGADAGNYTVTANATGVTADIAKLAITGSYTAANKTYDATTAATVTGTLSGVLGSDAVALSGTGTFADKNAGTGKAVTIGAGGLTGADAGNYTVTAGGNGVTADITKLAITGSYTAANKTYDATTAATVTGSLVGVLGADAVSLNGTGTFADKNAGTGKAVSVTSTGLSGADAGNYTVTANTTGVTANIGKLAITGSYTAANKTYDATTAAAVTGSLAGVLGTDAVTLGGTGTFADKNAGNGKAVTITNSAVTGADAGNYTVTANTSGVTADIAKLAITGSYSAANKTYDATTAAAVTGTLSGVLGTDDVALNGTGTFADKNAGTGKAVTIGAGGLTGADAGNYTVTASTAGVTANIGKLAITGSYTAANKTYDATTTATVTGTLSGVLGTDAVVLSGTGAFADKNAGTGKAVTIGAGGLTGADAGNYTVTAGGNGVTADITKLAITGSYTAANKTYDATTAATVTGSLVGVLGTDAVSLNGTGTFADKNAGTGKAVAVTLTGLGGADAANYTVTANTAGVRANIGKLAIAGSYSAANKTYDATTVATVTGSLAGVLGTDAVALNGTGAFADKNAGTGKAVSVTSNGLSGADAGNYTVTASTAGVTADIGKLAITGSYSAANKTYDATTAATVTGSLAGVLGTDAVALGGTGAFADKNAGTGKAVSVTSNGLSGADAGNYTVTASTAGVTANIAKLAITGSYSAANKTYDATTAATVSGTLSGVLGTDAVALSGTGIFADKNAGTSKAVTVTSNGLSGADAGNYTVTADATGVTADIAKLAITGNYTAANKVYEATTAATVTGNLSGVLGTDAVALNGTGSFADKNAGTGKAVTVTSNGLSGADAGNYTVTADTTGVTADIASRAITGNYTAANKVYDATTAATVTGNLSGVLGTDAVALNGTGAFADKNAGNGKAVSVTSSGLSGADAGNYTVTADISGVTADIAKRAITGNYTAANKVYDATTAATVTGNLTGVLGADVVALNGTGSFADKNAGTGKAVSVTSSGLSGADAGNYTVTADTSGVTADIARRAITGAFTAADKTYDATTAATVAGNLAGVLGTDAVTLDGIGTFADKNAGRGKQVTIARFTLDGSDAANYALTANGATTADITPKALVLTGAKSFDGTAAADAAAFGSRGTLAGVGNETVQLSGSGTLAGARPGRQALASLGSLALGDGANGGLAANYSITPRAASVLVGAVPVTPEAPTPEAPAALLPTGAQAAIAQAQSTAVSRDALTADGLGQSDGPSRSATAGGDPVTFVPDPMQRPAGAPGSQVALSVVDGGVRLPADALCVDGACAGAPASSNSQAR